MRIVVLGVILALALPILGSAVSFPDRLTPKSKLLRFKERLCGSQSSARPRLLAS